MGLLRGLHPVTGDGEVPDPFELARAKNRIVIGLVLIGFALLLPYILDYMLRLVTGYGIYSNPPDFLTQVKTGSGRTLLDLLKTAILAIQILLGAGGAVLLGVNILRVVTAE